jgi:hypothetical protein
MGERKKVAFGGNLQIRDCCEKVGITIKLFLNALRATYTSEEDITQL